MTDDIRYVFVLKIDEKTIAQGDTSSSSIDAVFRAVMCFVPDYILEGITGKMTLEIKRVVATLGK